MSASTDPRLLNAYVDGELDLVHQLEMETRLADDERLRDEVAQLRQLRDNVRDSADYHRAPAALVRGLRAVSSSAAPARAEAPRARWTWPPALAAAALVVTLMLGGGSLWWRADRDERALQELVTSHVRATLSQHWVDVASSDQHTVKPWLSARLDYSPPVQVPAWPSLVFVGGRIDYLDGRPTAALVFKLRAHMVDVFVAPAAGAEVQLHSASLRGFNIVQDLRAGMRWRAVSDLNADELGALLRAIDGADAAR